MSPRILWSWAALALLAAVAALALTHAPAAAAPAAPQLAQTEIVVTPRKDVYAVGDVVTVTVQLSNLADFAAADLKWQYDAVSFQVIDENAASEGVQMKPGDLFAGEAFAATNVANNSTGHLHFVATRLRKPGFSGNGSVVTIRFRVVAGCGSTQFELRPGLDADPNRLLLLDMTPNPITFQEAIPFTLRTPACPNRLYLPHLSKSRG